MKIDRKCAINGCLMDPVMSVHPYNSRQFNYNTMQYSYCFTHGKYQIQWAKINSYEIQVYPEIILTLINIYKS